MKVPAGVEEGARILYSNEGEAGVFGGPPGDLYIVLHVKEHSFFEREGKRPVLHRADLVLAGRAGRRDSGADAGRRADALKIPEGTQTGSTFKLKNKGVPVLNGRGRGDLFVEVKVQTPAKLSKRQRELMQELHTSISVENKPVSRSLLNKVKEIFG